jgi:hypothetical protein
LLQGGVATYIAGHGHGALPERCGHILGCSLVDIRDNNRSTFAMTNSGDSFTDATGCPRDDYNLVV